MTKPIRLLIRRIVDGKPCWLKHSDHADEDAAARTWERRIKGQGVTAWSWWGPREIAKKMLADPNYVHPADPPSPAPNPERSTKQP